jgi:hypothetical protein
MKALARLLVPTAVILGGLSPLPASAQMQPTVIDVELETANRPVGTAYTVTATVTQGGQPVQGNPQTPNVAFGIPSGGPSTTPAASSTPHPGLQEAGTCTTGADGKCSFTVTGNATGTTTIRGWIRDCGEANAPPAQACPNFSNEQDNNEGRDENATAGGVVEPDRTDVVLDVELESQAPAPGTEVTLTATVKENVATNPKTLAANVDFEITGGPNKDFNKNAQTADFECDAPADTGTCTVKYTGSTTPGIDVVRAHIDANDNGKNAPEADAKGDEIPGEADGTEQRDAAAPGGAGGTAEPDRTDVVEVNWGGVPAPTPPGTTPKEDFCNKNRDGANKKEILIGDEFANRICGFGGNDSIKGLAGNDALLGGEGDDNLKGGEGNDKLNGAAGKKDVAIGGKGKDTCKGTEKSLTCEGGKKKKKKKKT